MGTLEHRSIDHGAIYEERTNSFSVRGLRCGNQPLGLLYFLIAGGKNGVGYGHLGWMNTALPVQAKRTSLLCFGSKFLRLIYFRKRAVEDRNAGFRSGETRGEPDSIYGGAAAGGETAGKRQVHHANLQPNDARVSGSDFKGQTQALGRFNIGKDSDRLSQSGLAFAVLQCVHGQEHVVAAFYLGKIDDIEARYQDLFDIRAEQAACQRVYPHDFDFPVCGSVFGQILRYGAAGGLLAGEEDRIFEIEGERIGLAGCGLGEQLRPRAGDK